MRVSALSSAAHATGQLTTRAAAEMIEKYRHMRHGASVAAALPPVARPKVSLLDAAPPP